LAESVLSFERTPERVIRQQNIITINKGVAAKERRRSIAEWLPLEEVGRGRSCSTASIRFQTRVSKSAQFADGAGISDILTVRSCISSTN
jgi:hypothetical protein